MTWSQITLFARAAQQRKVDDYLMQATIIHNPYHENEHAAQRLFTDLRRERARLQGGPRQEQGGVRIAEIAKMLGGVQRVQISREELEAKRLPRGAGD